MKNQIKNSDLEKSIEEKRLVLKSRIIEILSDTTISSGTQIEIIDKELEKSRIEIRRLL